MKKLSLSFLFLLAFFMQYAQLPTSFDLRDSNLVTGVRSQSGGTCWTHGTMAAIESNLLVTKAWQNNGETGEPNLAEYHLDWWNGFNDNYNADIGGGNEGLQVHMGGDYRVSTAYLSRGDGAVRDIDGQSYDNPPDYDNPDFHYFYPRDVVWLTMDNNFVGMDSIKKIIMRNGALATCMCYDDSFIDGNYNHYQPESSSYLPNHSVTIVGWDDNHSVPAAPGNGAWLVKNSWGTGWGNNGYFWISYYDKWACREHQMGAVSFYNVEPMQYSIVYYHDYHGWRDTKTDIKEACNAFHCRDNVWLTSVSFFAADDDIDYKIKIYKTFVADSFSNAVNIKTGHITHLGFHTIDLDVPVKLNDGDDFYIYLYLSNGGHPYDRTSLVPVLLNDTIVTKSKDETLVRSAANQGESFYFDTIWHDFYFYDDPSGYDSTGNFCIKGLAKDSIDRQIIGAMFHVLDYNNHGINNASVTFDTLMQISDNQGDAFFANIDNNKTYQVSFTASGYRNFDTTVYVGDSTLVQDIHLVKLSKNQEINNDIRIFPNPATNIVNIYGIEKFDYQILDMTGRTITAGVCSNGQINVENINAGIYLLKINTQRKSYSKKIIVK